jgi:hypothetical protein
MSPKKIFSTLLRWKFALLSSSVLLVIGASAQAETVTLGFNCLPSSQGWTYSGTLAENTSFAADGSSLVQTTLGTGSSSARYALINNGILDSSKPITLSLTARVLDHEFVTSGSTGLGFNFIIRDDVFQHRVGMTSSLLQVDNLFIALDTTTFHDYVFELSPGGGSKLFVDGILLASGEGFALGLSKLLLFGDSTIHENANVDITALSITVGTVGTPLDLLIGDVENLADCGILSGGQANSLIVKADVTIARLDSGNTTAACNELQAFINAVGALVRAGTLTPDEGQSLIDTANSISVENGC